MKALLLALVLSCLPAMADITLNTWTCDAEFFGCGHCEGGGQVTGAGDSAKSCFENMKGQVSARCGCTSLGLKNYYKNGERDRAACFCFENANPGLECFYETEQDRELCLYNP